MKKSSYTEIRRAAPTCLGAPYPPFDAKKINESKFQFEIRAKYCEATIEDGVGYIKWLSQEDIHPSTDWEDEVKRAFAANGLPSGSAINVSFGSRDVGYIHEYEMHI